MAHAASQRSELSSRAIINVWLAWMLSCAFLSALPMFFPFLIGKESAGASPASDSVQALLLPLLIDIAAFAVILAPAIGYTLYTRKQGAFTAGNWLFLASVVCWAPLLLTLYSVTIVPGWIESLKNAGFRELPWLSQIFLDFTVTSLFTRIVLTLTASAIAIFLMIMGTREA